MTMSSAQSTQSRAIPDGWVLVPIEPTEAMLTACTKAWQRRLIEKARNGKLLSGGNARESFRANYQAMLTAAMLSIHQPSAVPDVVVEVLAELERATRKFPTWPTDPLHAVAVLNEEVGELNKAALQQVYEPHKNPPGAVHDEAVQAAAMVLRFIASIDRYTFTGCQQHEQAALAGAEVRRG